MTFFFLWLSCAVIAYTYFLRTPRFTILDDGLWWFVQFALSSIVSFALIFISWPIAAIYWIVRGDE